MKDFKIISQDFLPEGDCWVFDLRNKNGVLLHFVTQELSLDLKIATNNGDNFVWVNDKENDWSDMISFLGLTNSEDAGKVAFDWNDDNYNETDFYHDLIKKMVF